MIMMSRFVVASGAVAVLLPAGAWGQVTAWRHSSLYESRCASCDGNVGSDPRAPSREALQAFSPERVLEALTTGRIARLTQCRTAAPAACRWAIRCLGRGGTA